MASGLIFKIRLMLGPGVQQALSETMGTNVWPKVQLVPSWYVVQDDNSINEQRSMDTLV
jgi:hypothetical protein